MGSLKDQICLVAGASRGVGKGIARGLGAQGASVVVTGRSTEAGARTDGRPETIEDCARLVSMAGGTGYPYRCDHSKELEVDRLAVWHLRRFGRIDVLVLNVWSGNEGYDGSRYGDDSRFGTPFWRRPVARLGQVLESGLYANLLTARAFAPAMVSAKRGLIVTVTFDDDGRYVGDVFYDLAKSAQSRLAFIMAQELADHGVVSLALAPGFVRTERVRDAGLAEEATESPLFIGRAVAALAADPDVARHAGKVLHTGDLARDYGFQDEDGSRPDRFHLPHTEPS
jgi:NAD(P)-dependent dehydrogenase (short-subunit alcohol dehydrogenase family)